MLYPTNIMRKASPCTTRRLPRSRSAWTALKTRRKRPRSRRRSSSANNTAPNSKRTTAIWADEASIAAYRELAEFLAVTPFWGLDEETSIEYDTAIREYLSGLIDIDEFIARIDQKLKMIVLEGQ